MNSILKLTVLAFFGASIQASAQNCKFDINKVDDFSKKELLLTKSSKLASGYDYNLSVSIGAENKNPYLLLSANYSTGAVVGTVDPSFFILLNDGGLLEFTSTSVEGGRVAKIIYPITIENLNKIKEIGLKKIKFEATRFSEEYEIKKTDKKLVQNIECVLKEIE